MRLLFCVHRYLPFAGGSERFVGDMAEEAKRRGHDVVVLAGEHRGNHNGVIVSSNADILLAPWDLVVVHGAGPAVQNFVLSNARNINSKLLYMIILPDESPLCLQALNDCDFIGWSTQQDWDHCKTHSVENKAVRIRHGVNYNNCIGQSGFKANHNITGKMFVSCGGYWPNKAMRELAQLFETNDIDGTLITTGYDNRMNLMPYQSKKVIPMLIDNRFEVLSAIKDSDCLIMHSYQEGFGLVLLEASLNKTPWIAREIAGAKELKQYGQTYNINNELVSLLQSFDKSIIDVDATYNYVMNNHLIGNTIDDIEAIKLL